MLSPALDDLTARLTGPPAGAVATLDIHASLGKIARHLEHEDRRRRDFLRAVRGINFPAVTFPVVSGALTVTPNAVLLGPEDGQVWDIRRVTLAGWTTADAAINVNLFREQNTPTAGNLQNRLKKFNDSAPGNETWNPGGGLLLHSPDSLLVTGSGFTTTTAVIVTLEGVQVQADYEAEYLI